MISRQSEIDVILHCIERPPVKSVQGAVSTPVVYPEPGLQRYVDRLSIPHEQVKCVWIDANFSGPESDDS
jgi:hypothetical protein